MVSCIFFPTRQWLVAFIHGLVFCGFFAGIETQSAAAVLWSARFPDDACLIVMRGADSSGDGKADILAGFESGRVVCWSAEPTSPPLQLWSAQADAAIQTLLPLPDADGDGMADVVVADSAGWVRCLRGGAAIGGAPIWSFRSLCRVACLVLMPDTTGDGFPEVLAGGAEQKLFLLDGRTGEPVWTADLARYNGEGYVHRIVAAGDLNGNNTPDAVVLVWSGSVAAFEGTDGSLIWSRSVTSGFTEALDSMGDVNGDGVPDFVAGGNNKRTRLVSGATGTTLWDCPVERPVRAVCAVPDVNDDATTDCFAVTAGGRVACISGKGSGVVAPHWTAELGEVCRAVVSPGDLDGDGKADAVAGAENGVVAAFSGADGSELWRWTGPDVIRSLACVGDADGDGVGDIVAGSLDGSVTLLSGSARAWSAAPRLIASSPPPPPTACSVEKAPPPAAVVRNSAAARQAAENASKITILLYHDIITPTRYAYSVSVENFRAQMDVLVAGGFTAVSLDEIADWIEGKITLPEKSVCITFDGPYEGHVLHAWPILRERGLFAASYVTSDWIGTVNHADWHHLRRMDAAGIQDIQNHSANHPALTSVSRDEVIAQLTACNESIRRRMNGKVSLHHAYPGGAYNTTVMGILDELGFRTATTVAGRPTVRTDALLALPRYTLTPSTSIPTFKSWIGYEEYVPPMPYRFIGTLGSGWSYPAFGERDAQGRPWICDYAAGVVRVFETNGSEAAFSPIREGTTQSGQTRSLYTVSGLAVTPGGDVLVTIADYISTPGYFGVFTYRGSDGAFLAARDLDYRPGDVDCDAEGRIYIVDKVVDKWHVYDAAGTELPGSPIGPATTNHIQRGISVRPDASRVYVISETSDSVRVWHGSIDAEGCHYTQGYDLVSGLGGSRGGVDVMDNGTIFVGADATARVLVFDAAHTLLGAISGGSPALTLPAGTLFTPDGSTLWIISRNGFVQRWERKGPTGWICR
jgi:peptidoglycan/xylan/chitin deacetylase (PgdA/CDA1 family)